MSKIYRNKRGALKAADTKLLVVGFERIVNPTAEDFARTGYKIVVDAKPEYDESTQRCEQVGYEEVGDTWVRQYEVTDIEEDEEDFEVDSSEVV